MNIVLLGSLLMSGVLCLLSCGRNETLINGSSLRIDWNSAPGKNSGNLIQFFAVVPETRHNWNFMILHRKLVDEISASKILETTRFEDDGDINGVDFSLKMTCTQVGQMQCSGTILDMVFTRTIFKSIDYGLVELSTSEVRNIFSDEVGKNLGQSSGFIKAIEIEFDDDDVYYIIGI